jgi:hypothetical protein
MIASSRLALVVFFTVILSNSLAMTAIAKTIPGSQCPSSSPKTYTPPKKTKYISNPQLGISVKSPIDHRWVYVSSEKRFEIMDPPQYKSYACKVKAGSSSPLETDLSARSLSYFKVIKNPKRLPLKQALEESEKSNGDYAEYSTGGKDYAKLRVNGTDFITTSVEQGDPMRAWFIPKSRPNIVILYAQYCDCGAKYESLVKDLERIR